MKKILLFTTFSSHKDYIIREFILQLQTMSWYYSDHPDYHVDFLLMENSADAEYHKQFTYLTKDPNFQIKHINPAGREIKYYLTECQEYARQLSENENYDYLFSLECDIFPPINVIELLEQQSAIINQQSTINNQQPTITGAGYWISFGYGSHFLWEIVDKVTDQYHRTYCKTILSAFLKIDGQTHPAYGIGIGCILISKDIISSFRFRVSEISTGPSDKFFNRDMYLQNIQILIDTSILCHHENMDWKVLPDYNELTNKIDL
ncbi:MAG: hypothetical protein PF448_08715 [Bacteroidales bacterium]|jgi:hypothetical protein|nr:hypothetical protein [Bacteroidales bacterium]